MRRIAFALTVLTAAAALAEEALVDVVVVNGAEIPEPMADWTGSPEAGAALVTAAGCLDCHGGAAPDLGAASAGKSAGRLRLALVAPSALLGETSMPAYYAVGLYGEAPEQMVGRTRLTAVEIEQILGYLSHLGALQNSTEK